MDLLDRLPALPVSLVAAITGATSILAGTIGEHTMRPVLSQEGEEGAKRMKDWEVARLYHLIHAAALASLAAKASVTDRPLSGGPKLTAILWTLGVAGFSGSIYAIVANRKAEWTKGKAKYATPLGGLTMMAGWLSVALW